MGRNDPGEHPLSDAMMNGSNWGAPIFNGLI